MVHFSRVAQPPVVIQGTVSFHLVALLSPRALSSLHCRSWLVTQESECETSQGSDLDVAHITSIHKALVSLKTAAMPK